MTSVAAMKIARMEPGGNAAIVRRGYEAFNTGDIATLTRLFDEGASWHTPGRSSIAGSRQGRDAVFGEDGRVVGVHHNSAERNGERLDVLCCIVFELKDGRILIGREHFYDLYAWDAFWS
jgi:uncharacterized protein